jgi:hypothetical protein
VALVGVVWVGQGIGLIGGSIMTNDPKWAVIGAVMIVVGVGLVVWDNRRRSAPPAA